MGRTLPPCACSIAGSDSGGGAGLQADLKVFAGLGVWGLSVVTAVTAQNTRGVAGISLTSPPMVSLQLETLCDEFEILAMKTGMLGDSGIIRAVARGIPEGVPLVLDPVMVSTSGHALLADAARDDLVRLLLPRATVVTPNAREAEVLSGLSPIRDLRQAADAGRKILELGPEYVLVKGGHLSGNRAADLLLSSSGEWCLSTPRYPYEIHGAGCCFSAALCAYLAHGLDVPEAFGRAKAYMDGLVRNARRAPSGIHVLTPGPEQSFPGGTGETGSSVSTSTVQQK
ncbi:MAG: bifunctional hydroxymethylpyrimidine kinase/phosphomethylpyrimidine kinase [Methanolinea sp.]|nr:bifunctional hydroxymethylpyrimidine kinase/phosphomethylpyrimidine kinase [Methanolinea sp.]